MENIWDCFLEVPKDSLVLNVDDDDILKVNEVLATTRSSAAA